MLNRQIHPMMEQPSCRLKVPRALWVALRGSLVVVYYPLVAQLLDRVCRLESNAYPYWYP